MSILDSVEVPKDRPPIITITGDAGIGKTTLAASFPSPIFIRSEDGLQSAPLSKRPSAFPVIETENDLWDQLKALIHEDHNYKSLVIDSVSELDRLFVRTVVDGDENKPKSINQALGGYGAGLNAVAARHQRIRKAADILNIKKKMNIVFISHADIEIIDPPDQDPYATYKLQLNKKSSPPYVNNVDVVGFLKLEMYTRGDKDAKAKKATSDGTRILTTYFTAANVSKNRYHITEDIEVPDGENPLVKYIPALRNAQPKKEAK